MGYGGDIPNVDADRKDALDNLGSFDAKDMAWTAKNTLMIALGNPSTAPNVYKDRINAISKSAQHLSSSKVLVSTEIVNNKFYLVVFDKGAADVARALRDELKWNFVGSASIPSGPSIT